MKIILFLTFLLVSAFANHKVAISEINGQLKIQNGGPFDYTIDLKDPFKLVDGSNQLLAVATLVANPDPKKIYNIGLGMACYERNLLHLLPELSITSVDIDHDCIQEYGKVYHKYLKTIVPKEEATPPRFRIHPGDGKDMLTQIEDTIVDIITVDILDSNWDSPKNLLFDKSFFSHAAEHLIPSGSIVVTLYQAGVNQIRRIKTDSGLKQAIHLTFQPGDKSAQAKVSVLVLSDKISCSRLQEAHEFFGETINIQKPNCKQI